MFYTIMSSPQTWLLLTVNCSCVEQLRKKIFDDLDSEKTAIQGFFKFQISGLLPMWDSYPTKMIITGHR